MRSLVVLLTSVALALCSLKPAHPVHYEGKMRISDETDYEQLGSVALVNNSKPSERNLKNGRIDESSGDTKIPFKSLQRRSAIIGNRYLWPDGVIFYEIADEFSPAEEKEILSAMRDISKHTCIKFKQRRDQRDFVRFIERGEGCGADVGRQSGSQELILNRQDGCITKGIIIHELMHSIGFFHEHSRSDRDKYVNINLKNVPIEDRHNFDKERSNHFNLKYDFRSIMHYATEAFAVNEKIPTIQAKWPYTHMNKVIGQRISLSATDIKKIKLLYKCDKK